MLLVTVISARGDWIGSVRILWLPISGSDRIRGNVGDNRTIISAKRVISVTKRCGQNTVRSIITGTIKFGPGRHGSGIIHNVS